jgi:hypothetical protein
MDSAMMLNKKQIAKDKETIIKIGKAILIGIRLILIVIVSNNILGYFLWLTIRLINIIYRMVNILCSIPNLYEVF